MNTGFGQLGYGDSNNRGDASGEMGDDLSVVDLGTGFTVTGITEGSYNFHSCAFDGRFDALSALKCWGWNGMCSALFSLKSTSVIYFVH